MCILSTSSRVRVLNMHTSSSNFAAAAAASSSIQVPSTLFNARPRSPETSN